MSYSRRQLYALGETFGDSATRMEAGGRIVYGGGGGGGDAPEPTTQITESGPTVTNTSGTSSTKLPGYINANTQDIVAKARAIGDTPYKAYTGQRVAEFTPDMLTAMERMRNQGVAGQTTEASGLASLAGQRASDYGMFNQGVQQFMNPYMQNVVDVERRKAQENADRQSAMLSGQAAKMGAFGGSGSALQQRALTRDTAQQLADIQTLGLDRAYQSAVGQYNTGISNTLAASGQLAGLGRDQFGQETDLIKNLGTSGDIQRQREQALLDVDYGNFAEKRDYAAKQLALQKALSSGLEYDTSTSSSSRSVSQPGKTVTQRVAAGGEIRSYADGGITSLLSDRQITEHKQMPISELARLALQAKEMERAQLRADQQNMDAQQAMMAQGPTTVYDDEMNEMRRIAAARQSGIAGLDGYEYSAAGGGIVAFFEGEEVPAPEESFGMPYGIAGGRGAVPFQDPRLTQTGIAQSVAALAANQQGVKPEQKRPAGGARSESSILDQIYGGQEDLVREASAKEMAAQQAYKDDLAKESKESGDFAAKARQKIEESMAGLEGADKSALESSVLDFGLRLLSAKGEKNMAKAIAGAGLDTLAGHKQALKDIAAKRDKYEDALRQVDEFEYGEKKGTRKEERAAILALGKADAALSNSLGDILGARGKDVLQLYRDRQSRAHAENMANKRTTSSGLGADRLELNALNSLRISAMAKLKAAQSGFDDEAIAQADADLKEVEAAIRAKTKMVAGSPAASGAPNLTGWGKATAVN